MPHRHKVKKQEVGQIRIYMTPGERSKKKGKGLNWLITGSPPLYKEIILAAKQDGISHATAHHTHYGFIGKGSVQGNSTEISNPALNMCVELIGPRDQLDHFCRKHGTMLKNKIIIYKHMEHWEVGAHSVHIDEAPEPEYVAPEPPLEEEPAE